MRTITIEFPYFPKNYGEEVIVEVEAMLFKGIKNAASDWDAEDYLDIISTAVYHNGDVLDIDIPRNVIYAEISAKVRDAEMTQAFLEESGGF